MSANIKRQKVVNEYKKLLGRNIYSQNMIKRECVFDKYKDGKYYSDCSSSVRWAYSMANIGLRYIGGNTVGIYSSPQGKAVNTPIKNGVPTNVKDLRVGDCLMFAGTNTSRAKWDYCGHIEMVYAINGNTVTLCGHGSGNPSIKNMVTYCRNRFNTKANTKLGNRGLIKIVRFIQDDTPKKVSSEKVYVVQGGDSLTKIANKFKTTVDNLVELNDIKNPNRISVGQKIKIATSTTSNVTTNIVTKDDFILTKPSSTWVRSLQSTLNKLRHRDRDGKALTVDGIVGSKTKSACISLRRGMRSDLVKVAQERLSDLGFDTNGIDGIYGKGTESAVIAMKKKIMGSKNPTGILGTKSWDVLLGIFVK